VRFSSSEYTEMHLQPGFHTGPHWGTYSAPGPLAGFLGAALREGGKEGKKRTVKGRGEFPHFLFTI